ncbi:MAG: metal-dependent hydrolase [Pseudomonadota bacterium]
MITAHLPSGYILGCKLAPLPPYGMTVALIGGILPDFDLLFFYFVDDRAIHHHRYWFHIPAFWLAVACIALPLAARFGRIHLALIFFAAITVHLLLDSISGDILWAVPFSNEMFSLISVPATQSHWILSYLMHWTILFEIIIWVIAFWLWRDGKNI